MNVIKELEEQIPYFGRMAIKGGRLKTRKERFLKDIECLQKSIQEELLEIYDNNLCIFFDDKFNSDGHIYYMGVLDKNHRFIIYEVAQNTVKEYSKETSDNYEYLKHLTDIINCWNYRRIEDDLLFFLNIINDSIKTYDLILKAIVDGVSDIGYIIEVK